MMKKDSRTKEQKEQYTGGGKLSSAREMVKYIKPIFDSELRRSQEHLVVVFLDLDKHILGWECVASGGNKTVSIDCKVIFKEALEYNSAFIAIAHNHITKEPPSPSKDDLRTTETVYRCGELLGLPLLDHVIVSSGGWYSFANNNRMGTNPEQKTFHNVETETGGGQ